MPNELAFRTKLWIKAKIGSVFSSYTGPRLRALCVETDTGSYLVPASDLSMARSLSMAGEYNKPLLSAIQGLIEADSRVLFVGTHVGTLLIPTARKCRRVVGIEANPNTFDLLQKNLLLNKIVNVDAINAAAFDAPGELEFLAARDNTGGSKVFQSGTNAPEFFYDNPTKIKVKGARVDDLLSEGAFDLIVMDIEGSEYKALKGMPRILKETARLIMEVHPLSVEKAAGLTPAQFFTSLPEAFIRATPLNVEGFERSYERGKFLEMYRLIQRDHPKSGVDVLFEKT